MNRFYFKNKSCPQKRCFEVYGIDVFTGIRYSLALCGSRNAAQKALDEYLVRIQPYDYYLGTPHRYEGLLFIEQTTIEQYEVIGKRNSRNELDYDCRILKSRYLLIITQVR